MNVDTNQTGENIYMALIGECRKRVDQIRSKITIMTSPTVGLEKAETPNRTPLEAELKALLNKIRELENDIVD